MISINFHRIILLIRDHCLLGQEYSLDFQDPQNLSRAGLSSVGFTACMHVREGMQFTVGSLNTYICTKIRVPIHTPCFAIALFTQWFTDACKNNITNTTIV